MNGEGNSNGNGDYSWHLDKRWHVVQIVSLVVMAVSAVVYVVQRDSMYDKRLALLENAQISQSERDSKQDRDVGQAFELMRRQLDRIEASLERVVDRSYNMQQQQSSRPK